MKNVCLLLICILIKSIVLGQESNLSYYKAVNKAKSLYKEKNYLESARNYSKVLNHFKASAKSSDYYDAACSWSLSNEPDSAFSYLYQAVNERKYINVNHIVSDSDLKRLHEDRRWHPLIDQVQNNKKNIEKGYNSFVVKVLDSIYEFDQGGRQRAEEIEKKYGYKSAEMKKYFANLSLQDSLNIIKVTSIIEKYGWLGPDKIGEQGSTTLFLVVQHAEKSVHEKFLPIMRLAVKNGNARSDYLALLEDRYALEQGKEQIYGSQIIKDSKTGKPIIAPIKDESNVDLRRESVGLEPLKDYAKLFHIDYVLKSNN